MVTLTLSGPFRAFLAAGFGAGEGVTTAAGEFIVMSAAAHEDSTAQVVAASTAAAMAKVQQSAAVDTIATAADASQKSAASALAAHSTAVKAQLDDEILKPIACELSEPGRTTMGVWDAAIAANAGQNTAAFLFLIIIITAKHFF